MPPHSDFQSDGLGTILASIFVANKFQRVIRVSKPSWGRGEIIALVLMLAACGLTGFLIAPSPPKLRVYEYEDPRAGGKHAGDHSCRPSILTAIREHGQRMREADRCAAKAENQRQQTYDRIQQTRAADASVAQAEIAAQAVILSFIQTIGGILTLIAAGWAAYYARSAAQQTRRGANAANDANRPWLQVDVIRIEDFSVSPTLSPMFQCTTSVTNHGNSPAFDINIVGTIIPVEETDGGLKFNGIGAVEGSLEKRLAATAGYGHVCFPRTDFVQDVGYVGQALADYGADQNGRMWEFVIGATYKWAGGSGRTMYSYSVAVKGADTVAIPDGAFINGADIELHPLGRNYAV